MSLRVARPLALHQLERDLGTRVEAALERGDIDRLGVGAEGLEGIDFFMCGPRSFRMRMWIGICPPSKLRPALVSRAGA